MTTRIDPYHLLEKAREGWQNFVSNELVQGFELVKRNPFAPFSYLKDYMSGNVWLEVLLGIEVLGHEEKFVAIIVCADDTMASEERQIEHEGQGIPGERDMSMFIGITHVVQPEQRMRRRLIPSRVWLKPFDEFHLSAIKPANTRRIASPSRLDSLGHGILVENRELGGTKGCFPTSASERPRNLVKGGAEIVGKLPYKESYPGRGRPFDSESDSIHWGIRIGIDVQRAWLTVLVPADASIKRAEMFVRPLDLQPWPIKWMHDRDVTTPPLASQSRKGKNAS